MIKEREKLLREFRRYEKDCTDKYILIMTDPTPDIRYRMNLQYLVKTMQIDFKCLSNSLRFRWHA